MMCWRTGVRLLKSEIINHKSSSSGGSLSRGYRFYAVTIVSGISRKNR